jgi:hypothetical protein
MAGFLSDFADELALRASVAFAKRMSSIDLAEKARGPLGEPIGIQAREMILASQLSERLLQCRFDKSRECKEMPDFGNVHCPEASSPFVYILKDVPMNCFQMR